MPLHYAPGIRTKYYAASIPETNALTMATNYLAKFYRCHSPRRLFSAGYRGLLLPSPRGNRLTSTLPSLSSSTDPFLSISYGRSFSSLPGVTTSSIVVVKRRATFWETRREIKDPTSRYESMTAVPSIDGAYLPLSSSFLIVLPDSPACTRESAIVNARPTLSEYFIDNGTFARIESGHRCWRKRKDDRGRGWGPLGSQRSSMAHG